MLETAYLQIWNQEKYPQPNNEDYCNLNHVFTLITLLFFYKKILVSIYFAVSFLVEENVMLKHSYSLLDHEKKILS